MEQLIYGMSPYGYLAVVPEAKLVEETRRIRDVFSASTYGEARKHDAPAADDDQFDDADPYDVREVGGVEDGDWPPNAAMLALDTLPDDVKALGSTERSMVGQEWVEFDAADEERVVSRIRSLGYPIRRDDAVIEAFDGLANG